MGDNGEAGRGRLRLSYVELQVFAEHLLKLGKTGVQVGKVVSCGYELTVEAIDSQTEGMTYYVTDITKVD